MQTAKKVFIDTIKGGTADRVPCGLHWWGIYKYEALGLDFTRDAWKEGKKLAEVYAGFYEKFKPDWFHLHIGTPVYFKDSGIVRRDGKSYLVIDPQYRSLKKDDRYFSVNSPDDEEIVDFPDYLLGSRSFKPKVNLGSLRAIDDYVRRYIRMSAEEITAMGYTDHVREIVRWYGEEVFIAVHIPSAVCEIFDPTTGYVGFEEGLMAFYDHPEGMRHLFERCYEEQLEWAKAYAQAGAHSYVISETYISPDITDPAIYRNNLKGIHRDYFAEISRMGMIPICNFWGDVNPILEDLTEINISALMVEESKKQFTIDIHAIREAVGDRLCVFGNLDSITLLVHGTPDDIRAEVLAQAAFAPKNFVAANGSPVAPDTPEENVRAFIDTVHENLHTPGAHKL